MGQEWVGARPLQGYTQPTGGVYISLGFCSLRLRGLSHPGDNGIGFRAKPLPRRSNQSTGAWADIPPNGASLSKAQVRSRNDRASLINALCSLTAISRKRTTRDFLEGLSRDELGYIANYLGARVLDPRLAPAKNRAVAAERIQRFQRASTSLGCEAPWDSIPALDSSHKMIILLEYLTLSELRTSPKAFATARGAA